MSNSINKNILKNSISKNKLITAFVLILLMASALQITVNKPVEAQLAAQQPQVAIPSGVTANVTAETIAHLSFRPRTVGIGQSFLLNMWIEATTLSASYKHFQAYRVTFTKPDGTQDVITTDSYVADTTAWFEYTADQVGQWSIKLDYLGQYFPAGRYLNGYIVANTSGTSITQSVYYKPSSDGPHGLVVQAQQVLSWPPAPLPTDYWTRPVSHGIESGGRF